MIYFNVRSTNIAVTVLLSDLPNNCVASPQRNISCVELAPRAVLFLQPSHSVQTDVFLPVLGATRYPAPARSCVHPGKHQEAPVKPSAGEAMRCCLVSFSAAWRNERTGVKGSANAAHGFKSCRSHRDAAGDGGLCQPGVWPVCLTVTSVLAPTGSFTAPRRAAWRSLK